MRPGPAWLRPYGVSRDGVLLRRLRWCIALTVLGVLVAVGCVMLAWPASFAKRVGFSFKFGAVCLAAWELARRPGARAHARTLALGYVVALIGLLTATVYGFPRQVPLAPSSFVAVMVGTALLLPWGVVPQAVVCGLSVAASGWLAAVHPGSVGPWTGVALVAALGAALLGAYLLEEYGVASFARGWQQRELLALSRDLARAAEPQAVIATVLAHARRLLATDAAAFASYDGPRHLFRIDGLATEDAAGTHWVEGFEIPEDFPLVRKILARGTMAVPDDDGGGGLRARLAEHGAQHVLTLVLRHGHELIGILGLVRADDVAFSRRDRLLARGLADQAALAMRTARLVADLRHATRLKTEFVANVSHELRTPLTVILGFAEMARDRSIGADDRDEFLGRIERAGRDLLGLIETTLEIGKLEAGRDAVHLEPVPLPAFWAGIGEACAQVPRAPAVRLEWEAAVPDIALVTDPRKLTVVVRNLVGNALKFTERGVVRAELRVAGERILVRVSDTGIGIRPEDQASVFELFRQADGSSSRRYEGTGLGLYVVHRFVQQLGGSVDLESVPGEGSVFTVTLPCVPDASPLERAA